MKANGNNGNNSETKISNMNMSNFTFTKLNKSTCPGHVANISVADGSNLYNLRRLFYPPTSGTRPVLANITYYMQLSPATAEESAKFTSSDNQMCECQEQKPKATKPISTGVFRYGWTTVGIYTFIHPALLNQLQVQLPFTVMKLATPQRVPFLWDGYNQLPSADIHLNVSTDNLMCLPDLSEMDNTMKTLTSLVRAFQCL